VLKQTSSRNLSSSFKFATTINFKKILLNEVALNFKAILMATVIPKSDLSSSAISSTYFLEASFEASTISC
jgi:hypothetical protein